MTIRSKIFEKFVDERGASHAAVLRRMEDQDGVVPSAPQGSRSSRVACARPPPAVPARPVVARSSPGLPRLPRRRLFDSCTHITPGHPPHTAVACPMCRMRHVGLGRALSYRSSCAVPQSSSSIEAGPWTPELRSPPAVRPRRLFDSCTSHKPQVTPHTQLAHVPCVAWGMWDLAALSRTGARVPCLKARIPSRLGHGLNSAPPLLCFPAQCQRTTHSAPLAWLCVHVRVPCT